MEWFEDFKVEGRIIEVDEARGTPRAICFFPFAKESIESLSLGTFVLADSRRITRVERRSVVMQVIGSEVFHSGLVGLDPKRLPFPTSVLEVAKTAQEDLFYEDYADSGVRLAGVRVTALSAGYEVWGTEPRIERSGEQPLLGSRVYKPTPGFLDFYFNRHMRETGENVLLGTYHSGADAIQILANPRQMVEHHVGVFGTTGSGKSFLISDLISAALGQDIRFVVFDCAPEFPALLLDIIAKSLSGESRFSTSIVIRDVEDISLLDQIGKPEAFTLFGIPDPIKARFIDQLHQLLGRGRHSLRPLFRVLLPAATTESLARLVSTFFATKRTAQAGMIGEDLIESIRQESPGRVVSSNPGRLKKLGIECIDAARILNIVATERGRHTDGTPMAKYLDELIDLLSTAVQRGDARADDCVLRVSALSLDPSTILITPSRIFGEVASGGTRLQIVLSDFGDTTRDLMAATIGSALQSQRETVTKPHVMFVVDEAHEFVPQGKGESSWAIERLAREGRKLHLGLLMASQRCTYLNTSVMAQLGTVFFTNLRMRSDRERVEQAFDIDRDLIDSSTHLGPREWYLVSGSATGLKGFPIHIEATDVVSRIDDGIA